MKDISDIFNKFYEEISDPRSFLSILIKNEFNKIKIELTKEQNDKLVMQILSSTSSAEIKLSDEQIKKAGYSSENDLKEEVEKIFNNLEATVSKSVEKFTTNLPNTMLELADDVADYMLNKIKKDLPSYLADGRSDNKNLRDSINETWGKSLDLLEVLIGMSLEIGERYKDEDLTITDSNKYLYDALFRLHARACQTSSEILTLLRSGYADGANARWRSLYEIVIICFFIRDHGNELTKKYLDYQLIDSYKEILQHQEYAEILGYEPFSEEEIKEFVNIVKQLDDEYGTEYKKGGYGWASAILNKKKTTFRDIEQSIDQEHMRPFYKRASYNIHAAAISLFSQLGLHESDNIMLAGPSNLGLVEPCKSTAVSLAQITTTLIIDEEPEMGAIVASRMLSKLEREIESVAIQEEYELLNSIEKIV